MVAQIEHTRKPGRGVARLVPETVLVLQLYEVIYATLHDGMLDLARRHEAQ